MKHPINEALIKIVGVFAYEHKKHIPQFLSGQYETMDLVDLPQIILDKGRIARQAALDGTRANYKNTYYAEFRDFMFTGKNIKDIDGFQKAQIRSFQRKKNLQSSFHFRRFDIETKQMQAVSLPLISHTQEIYLFPGGIGIFSLNLQPDEKTLEHISDLINQARSFESKVGDVQKAIDFHKWVSEEVLCGIPLVGIKLELDEYSGSKFKVYSVIDMPAVSEVLQYNREHLLYEIGTSSPIGVVANTHRMQPAESYYDELLQNKISAFRNYDCLALLDSFTVIGTGNYAALNDNSESYIPHHLWNRAYFGIYVYNLFLRYSLFKFNAQFLSNPVKYRDQFQDFLNHYDLKHISFNFLPNMIFEGTRKAMRIDEEIETFEKRLGNLATSIQEQQEKRQAFLLTLISVISAFDAIDSIWAGVKQVQATLGWSNLIYYPVLLVLLITIGSFLLQYLFPLIAQKLKRKLRKVVSKQVNQ